MKSIISFVLIIFWFCLIGCTKQISMLTDMPPNDVHSMMDPVSYLALGDSYTIGEGVEESLRWPNQLGKQLEEQGYEIQQKRIIATTGWTTGDLLKELANTDLEEYNLVSLLIGVNNQYQGQAFNIFEKEFQQLLDKSIEIAGTKDRIFLVSIPDYGVTPFGKSNASRIATELDAYNLYMKNKCEALDIPFVDITGISRQLGDSTGALASDGLHPSGAQYTRWVDEILPVVIELLKG